jgi:hypothetical protein
MVEMKQGRISGAFRLLAFLAVLSGTIHAQGAIIGVNASMASLSVEQQNAILSELHAAGVHAIRAGITA